MNLEAPLFIRLSLDEDVHKRVAAALQLRHFDVVSAHELGRWGLSDEEQAATSLTTPSAPMTARAMTVVWRAPEVWK